MFFVVDKPRLQRMIAIVREDKRPNRKRSNTPYLRLKAVENELTVSSDTMSATFPATVYEQGVLFLRTTLFRRLVQSFKGSRCGNDLTEVEFRLWHRCFSECGDLLVVELIPHGS